MTAPAPPPWAAPPPRRGPPWPAIFGLVALFSVAGVVLAAVAIWALTIRETPLPFGPGERALVVTAAQLAAGLPGHEVDPSLEVASAGVRLDGSAEVEYEYDASERGVPFYVSSTAALASSERDARDELTGFRLGLRVGVAGESLALEPRDDLLAWGDARHCFLLVQASEVVGTACAARKDRRLFTLVVAGVALEEPGSVGALVEANLAALERWEPSDSR